MLEAVDCAVLVIPSQAAWTRDWMAARSGLGRVRLHGVMLAHEGPQALSALGLSLRRYDVCALPVSAAALSWTRTALACVPQELPVPLLGVLREVRAAAVRDLLALGMADFVHEAAGDEELQARLAQLARRSRFKPDTGGAGGPAGGAVPAAPLAVRACEEAAAPASVEPFKQAKSRIVASFERDYLNGALARHAGNISSAARAARKHRRAFWALMRKHRIDAAPFREAAPDT